MNLGNQAEISVKKLAEMVISMTKSKSKIAHKNLPNDDPTRRCPDISLARERLGWTPKVPLEEGLQRTIDYFRGVTERLSVEVHGDGS
jgi:UDP-glucuronate decarboxylase